MIWIEIWCGCHISSLSTIWLRQWLSNCGSYPLWGRSCIIEGARDCSFFFCFCLFSEDVACGANVWNRMNRTHFGVTQQKQNAPLWWFHIQTESRFAKWRNILQGRKEKQATLQTKTRQSWVTVMLINRHTQVKKIYRCISCFWAHDECGRTWRESCLCFKTLTAWQYAT